MHYCLKWTSLVANKDNWTKSNKSFDVLVYIFIQSVCNKELGGSKRMAEINNLSVTSRIQDIIQIGRNIIPSHLVKREIPKFLVSI